MVISRHKYKDDMWRVLSTAEDQHFFSLVDIGERSVHPMELLSLGSGACGLGANRIGPSPRLSLISSNDQGKILSSVPSSDCDPSLSVDNMVDDFRPCNDADGKDDSAPRPTRTVLSPLCVRLGSENLVILVILLLLYSVSKTVVGLFQHSHVNKKKREGRPFLAER